MSPLWRVHLYICLSSSLQPSTYHPSLLNHYLQYATFNNFCFISDWFFWILDLKRDSSICSAKDRLIKNPSHILDIYYKKEKHDNSVTKLLILLTLLFIFFLFWIQNSHYHLINNLRQKYQTKFGYWEMHKSSVNIVIKILLYLVHWSNTRFSLLYNYNIKYIFPFDVWYPLL